MIFLNLSTFYLSKVDAESSVLVVSIGLVTVEVHLLQGKYVAKIIFKNLNFCRKFAFFGLLLNIIPACTTKGT